MKQKVIFGYDSGVIAIIVPAASGSPAKVDVSQTDADIETSHSLVAYYIENGQSGLEVHDLLSAWTNLDTFVFEDTVTPL